MLTGKHFVDLSPMGFPQKAWVQIDETGKYLEFWFEPKGRVAKQELQGFLKQRDPQRAMKLAWYFVMKKYKRRYGNELSSKK